MSEHPLTEMVAALRERASGCLPEVFGADVALLDWMASQVRSAEDDGMAEGEGKFRDAVREMTLHLRSVSKRMDEALRFPRPEKETEPPEEYDPVAGILRAVADAADDMEMGDEEIRALVEARARDILEERKAAYLLALPAPCAAASP